MRNISAWSLFLVVSLLAVKVWSQGDFSLDDALDDVTKAPTVTPKPVPSGGGGQPDLDQDARHVITTTKAPPKAPKASLNPKLKPDDTQADFDFGASLRPGLLPHATKGPRIPHKPQPASDELDLADALDPNNDIGGKDKNKGQGIGGGGRGGGTPNNRGGNGGGSFSDDDLFGVSKDDTYKPDKGKGGRGGSQSADENNYDTDTMAETGTIAGIVSAVGVALVGAITSYISYQKKKFCFSIQQSLQGDLVKTENPDAVVATEPQVQQTLLEPPNAEPPSEENVV
ncbi:CD99 antigen-like protein 2 isoform X2 [Esox lucius]|uniref:CD99 antigen-like protein 2 isoform X2 n=1 Tax=Esox lucius TaxID=8010 RepID=UPI000973202E|nr:CD99 antigen-like protein 2 isoform X2 [Esox lucius]